MIIPLSGSAWPYAATLRYVANTIEALYGARRDYAKLQANDDPAALLAIELQALEEERIYQNSLKGLSPEAIERREINRRQELAARAEERRHEEVCQAIRSTSFWRFGA